MAINYKRSPQIKQGIESNTDVIKGGYQEVSPSPSPAPPSDETWGTAVPASKPSSEKSPSVESTHPPKK